MTEATGESAAERGERRFDLNRATAFSDGVFTIAATLLVLSIDVPNIPDAGSGALRHALSAQTDQFVSYAISFAVIGLLWFRHHRFFHDLAEVDGPFLALNLLYLAFVAFVPWPTEMLGKYGDEPLAPILYAATIAAISLIATASYWYAIRKHLFRSPDLETQARARLPWALVVPVVMLGSIPIAYVDTSLAQFTWLLMLVIRPGRALTRS